MRRVPEVPADLLELARSARATASGATSSSTAGSTPQGGQHPEQLGLGALVGQPVGQLGRTPDRLRTAGSHSPDVVGHRVERPVVGEHDRCRALAPSGQPGEAVGGVARPGPASRGWSAGPRRTCPRPRPRRSSCPFRRSSWTTRSPTTHWARSLSGVQMITRPTAGSSAATEAAEARASSASSSTMGHTMTPRATSAVSRISNWSAEVGSMPAPGLVAGPQVVAERLDDVVGGHAEVGGPLAQHAEHREHHAPGGADLLAVVGRPWRLAEELAEQLVGPVDQMHLHARSLAGVGPDRHGRRPRRTVRAGRPGRRCRRPRGHRGIPCGRTWPAPVTTGDRRPQVPHRGSSRCRWPVGTGRRCAVWSR